MARGRPPDPTRARRRTGQRPLPARRAPAGAPGVLAEVPPAPESLPAGARPFWDAACAELLPRGLRPSDLPLVEMLAVAACRHRQAAEHIAQAGLLEGEDGRRAHPLLKLEKDTAATYLRLAETLGLTPAARMRLGLMQVAGQSMLVAIREEVEAYVDAEERRARRRRRAATQDA